MATLNASPIWPQVRDLLPEGIELPRATWETRHRFILWVIAGHALALPIFGLAKGWGPVYSLVEGGLIAFFGVLAALPQWSRRTRSTLAGLALVSSSAVLVQFSGGYIEAHFHYFIVVALVALYQDWAPFLLAILFVALSHGLVGSVNPHWVFNHEAAILEPWKWGLIHAVAILGECVALLAFWSGAEQANARSDLVLDSAGEGVVGLDHAGRITFANPAAGVLLGRHPDDLIGADMRSFMPAVDKAFASPRTAPREDLLSSADGQHVPVEWTFTPTSRGNALVGAVMVLRDISERHAMEEQLRQHRLHLEAMVERRTTQLTEANRELEAFSYTVSHDLRSPLRSIDGFSRILMDRHGANLPEEARAMLGLLSDGALRMGNLIESILALSRLSRVELRDETVDVSAMAEGILEDLRGKDPMRTVECSVQPDLRARGDPGLLELAMQNLLQNAWKFTANAQAPRISVATADTEHGRAFVVEDNGAGFDMALSKDLFQPFHRLHTPTEFEGTGIGLATVNRIVKRHGGLLWADAEVNRGARFYFTLGTTSTDGVMAGQGSDVVVRLAETARPESGPSLQSTA